MPGTLLMPYGRSFHLGSNFKWPDFKYANVRHVSSTRWHSYLGLRLAPLLSFRIFQWSLSYKHVGTSLTVRGSLRTGLNIFCVLLSTGNHRRPAIYLYSPGWRLTGGLHCSLTDEMEGFCERNWSSSRCCESKVILPSSSSSFGRLLLTLCGSDGLPLRWILLHPALRRGHVI